MKNHRRLSLIVALLTSILATAAEAGEPNAPIDPLQPRTHIVELKKDTVIRMGDTVSLKDSDFSAKLVGFGMFTECAVPGQNCGAGYSPDPEPEFRYEQGTYICEPKKRQKIKPIDRNCLQKLKYTVTFNHISDRTAVTVRIVERK